jgi:hypothetical protein
VTPRPMDWLAWIASRLGWPGLGGLAFLAGAAVLHYALAEPARSEAQDLAARADRLAARQAAAADAPAEPTLAQRLPGSGRTPEAVSRLFLAAHRAGLSLKEGEYRLQTDPAARLLSYQITLPLEGGYPALREFLTQALNRNASLALEGINLTRETVESENLKAVLHFTLYLDAGAGS